MHWEGGWEGGGGGWAGGEQQAKLLASSGAETSLLFWNRPGCNMKLMKQFHVTRAEGFFRKSFDM